MGEQIGICKVCRIIFGYVEGCIGICAWGTGVKRSRFRLRGVELIQALREQSANDPNKEGAGILRARTWDTVYKLGIGLRGLDCRA